MVKGPDRDHLLRAVTESRLILTDERRLSKKTGFRVEAHLCSVGDCSVFKDSLHHSVVCIGDLGCCHSLCLLGSAGCYINCFAVAVEGDNLDLILFVAAVCVCGDDANVCHDFEVFDG